MRILISGGGTGGHIFPAVAIANALGAILAARGETADIRFVGALGRMEMERVPAAGYPIEGLNISGFKRGLSAKMVLQNVGVATKFVGSLWKARNIIKGFQPDAVVGVGGYASSAVVRVAQSMGIPTYLQEQNSYAGITNKFLARRARRIFVAYDGMERFFPADKLLLTGNPVRKDIAELAAALHTTTTTNTHSRTEAANYYHLHPDRKTILVVGGSLGARTLNEAIGTNAALIAAHPNTQILWQTGKLYYDTYATSEAAQLPNVHATAFLDRMELAYTLADVIISRAGALSISELCLVGKPALLVPSPNVAEDHQTRNAEALSKKNAAMLIKDTDARINMLSSAYLLLEESEAKHTNTTTIHTLSTNIRRLALPNAADHIAQTILDDYDRKKHHNS